MGSMQFGSLSLKLRDALVARILESVSEIRAVYAYGSRVKGGIHPESDLDLALLLPRECVVSAKQLFQLRGDLEAIAGFPVGVSILDLVSFVVHCKEVVSSGVTLYVADAQEVAAFEMQTLSNYARLCEDRAPVIKAYMGEQVHG